MAEFATLIKALSKVKPEQAAELEYQVDKNLLRTHPGLSESHALWYGGKMNSYLNEVTKNDTSQYAIAMMDPDELSKMIGRANLEDPATKDRVLDLYNRATSSADGMRSIVKLDGLVNEKGFIDVTRITPGSQETVEALRLIDRDRPPDVPAARIPVLVHASGAKWASDPAPRLRYNGQTSGTLSMPKWDARRPPPITQTVADAKNPTFYRDQPRDPEAVRAKLGAIYDPQAALEQGHVIKFLQSGSPLDEYMVRMREKGAGNIPAREVAEAKDYTRVRRERMREILDPVINQYGRDYVRSLVGKDNPLTMRLLGESGADADDPIVLMRTERFSTKPFKEGEFSPALSSPRETGMHAGEPITTRAFQGNSWYHDNQVAEGILKTADPKSKRYQDAQRVADLYQAKRQTLIDDLATHVRTKVPANKILPLLFDSVKEAKENLQAALKPGQRDSLVINNQGMEMLRQSLTNRLESYGVQPAAIQNVAQQLTTWIGLTEGTGTKSKPFMLKNVKRPLFLVDTGNFAPSNVLRQLRAMPEFEQRAQALLAKEGSIGDEVMSKEIHKLIESRGYDSAVYLNAPSEGAVNRYANLAHEGQQPEGFSPSFMIWKEDQIVPLDSPKLFPGRGDNDLKKALALLVTGGATKEKKDESTD